MGLSDKQFYTLLGMLFLVMVFGGFVFWIADVFGKVWGAISLSLVNVMFLVYIVLKVDRKKDNQEEKKDSEES